MNAPEVVLAEHSEWIGVDGKPYSWDRFEVLGGDVTPEWARGLRVPNAPWCSVTIWNGGTHVGAFGGEVWPAAWPALFRFEGPRGRQATILTDDGARLFAAARARGTVRP